MKTFPDKDPYALLDYVFDWNEWLGEDAISSYDVVVPEGLTLENDDQADGKVVVWLSGGTINKSYVVECSIVTTDGRVEKRSAIISVNNN